MGEPLTAERRAQLEAAVNAGDRRTYYTLLGQWGYKYGDLAKDVAFGDGINGAVANQYARQVAQSRGVKLTESQWKSLSIDLMRADWGMREQLGLNSTGDLQWSQYRNYHKDTFAVYGLPPEAWTAEIPLMGTGSAATSAQMWQAMLGAQSFLPQAINGLDVFAATSSRNPDYLRYTIAQFADGPGPGMMSTAAGLAYAFKKGLAGETRQARQAAEWTAFMTSTPMLIAIAKEGGQQAVDETLDQFGIPNTQKLRDLIDRFKSRTIPLEVPGVNLFPASLGLLASPIPLPGRFDPNKYEKLITDADGNPIGVSRGYYDFDGSWVELSSTVTIFARDAEGKIRRDQNNVPIQLGREDSDNGLMVRRMYEPGTEEVVSNDIVIPGSPPIDFSQAGGILGQQLGYRLAKGDALVGVVSSAVLQTLGDNIGDFLDGVLFSSNGKANGVKEVANEAFGKIDKEFLSNLKSAGVGAVSSFLTAELVQVLDLNGLVGEIANTAAGAVIGQILGNITDLALGTAAEGINAFTGVNLAMIGTAVGSFLGTKLASELVSFDTIGGQIGASVGASLGAIGAVALVTGSGSLASTFTFLGGAAGPIGAAVGAFLGFIVGGLIGSIFGGTPRSGADSAWDSNQQKFVVANVWSKKGGSKDAARSVASAVSDTFNMVLSVAGGTLLNPEAVQSGNYGMRKKAFVYKPYSTRDSGAITQKFSGKDAATKLIGYGVYQGLTDPDFQIVGGDTYVKRALYNTWTPRRTG